MKYLRIKNNEIVYPYVLRNLITEYPNTSFGDNLENLDLSNFNVYVVEEVAKPSDENYSKLVREGIPVLENGIYKQTWIVENAPEEYTQSNLQAVIDNKWSQVRNVRDQYLKETDWMMLIDSPLSESKKQEWITYRQLLRDITNQEDPFNITWPTKPE